jgi:transcriptional regulator with XRE-family HTH domain
MTAVFPRGDALLRFPWHRSTTVHSAFLLALFRYFVEIVWAALAPAYNVLRIRNTLGGCMSTSLAEELAPHRRASDFTARRLAAFAGVAPSTVTRIEKGQMQPTFDVARELLTLVGSPMLSASTESIDAIAVARQAVDGAVRQLSGGRGEWLTRWQRGGLIDSDGRLRDRPSRDELLRRTARVARVAQRRGVRSIPKRSWQKAIAALESADIDYALSGSPAANQWVSSAPDADAVLYVSDVDAAEELLWGLGAGEDAHSVFLLPCDGVSEADRQNIEGLWLASLTQIVVDCLGLPGRQPAQAEAILDNWDMLSS